MQNRETTSGQGDAAGCLFARMLKLSGRAGERKNEYGECNYGKNRAKSSGVRVSR